MIEPEVIEPRFTLVPEQVLLEAFHVPPRHNRNETLGIDAFPPLFRTVDTEMVCPVNARELVFTRSSILIREVVNRLQSTLREPDVAFAP
jgi:hypothetical protein